MKTNFVGKFVKTVNKGEEDATAKLSTKSIVLERRDELAKANMARVPADVCFSSW